MKRLELDTRTFLCNACFPLSFLQSFSFAGSPCSIPLFRLEVFFDSRTSNLFSRMSLRLSLLVICLLALAIDSKHHHNKENEPEFIKNLTNPQRSSFFGIAKNPGISIEQKETKFVEWAAKNNLTVCQLTIFRDTFIVLFQEQYSEFRKLETQKKEELNKNVTGVVERLSAAKVELDKVMADKTMTKIQQKEKINELKKTYPHEIDTLFYIGARFTHPKSDRNETRGSEGKGVKGHHKRN